MRTVIASAFACAVLTGCAQPQKMVWLRADGMRIGEQPALATQLELDSTSCLGQRNAASLSGVTVANGGMAGLVAQAERSNAADTVQRGCMAEKGYLWVAEDQAEQRAAELAAQRRAATPVAVAGPAPVKQRRL